MTHPPSGAQAPPKFGPTNPAPVDPAEQEANARFIKRVRWMMALSGFATVLGIAVVLGVIGYRLLRTDGSAPPDVTALLPKGAKVVSTTVVGDRVAVILDIGGGIEVRTFDLKTLHPAGRLKFVAEP
jgi:hypothetical protein